MSDSRVHLIAVPEPAAEPGVRVVGTFKVDRRQEHTVSRLTRTAWLRRPPDLSVNLVVARVHVKLEVGTRTAAVACGVRDWHHLGVERVRRTGLAVRVARRFASVRRDQAVTKVPTSVAAEVLSLLPHLRASRHESGSRVFRTAGPGLHRGYAERVNDWVELHLSEASTLDRRHPPCARQAPAIHPVQRSMSLSADWGTGLSTQMSAI